MQLSSQIIEPIWPDFQVQTARIPGLYRHIIILTHVYIPILTKIVV